MHQGRRDTIVDAFVIPLAFTAMQCFHVLSTLDAAFTALLSGAEPSGPFRGAIYPTFGLNIGVLEEHATHDGVLLIISFIRTRV